MQTHPPELKECPGRLNNTGLWFVIDPAHGGSVGLTRVHYLCAGSIISECQRGMVDPSVAVNPLLAAQAHQRNLPEKTEAFPLIATVTDAQAIVATLHPARMLAGTARAATRRAQHVGAGYLCRTLPVTFMFAIWSSTAAAEA